MLQERDYPPPPPPAYDYYYEDEGRRRGGGGGRVRRYSAEHDNRTRGPVIDVDQDLTDEDDELPSVRGARSFENFRVTIKNSDDKGATTKTANKKAKKSSKANNKPVSVSSGDGTPR